jgi:fatty-acyl-CoA synthase
MENAFTGVALTRTSTSEALGEGALWKGLRKSANDANAPLVATPTRGGLARRFSDFDTLGDALAYAAKSKCGLNYYDARGKLSSVQPYADLYIQAQHIARQLMGQGVEPGMRVALIAETSPEFVALFMGCILAATLPVPLPLPTSFGGREGYVSQIRNQLESCDPVVVVGPEGLRALVNEACGGLGLKWHGTWAEFADLAAPDIVFPKAHSSDISYLQYSSGSTRFPHGVMVTHAALLNNCHIMGLHGLDIQDNDRCISWLPFYHDMGLVGCLLTVLTNQVSTDFLATEDFARRPLTWLKLISENPDSSVSYSPTFGYEITARRAGSDAASQFDLSRFRLAGNGGDMIRPDVMQKFIDVFGVCGFKANAFMPSYGLAECTLGVSFSKRYDGIVTDLVDEDVLTGAGLMAPREGAAGIKRYRAIVNCGKPLPGYDIEIRHTDGHAMGERRIGKLYVRGPSVMTGYFRDQEATDACLENGWLDTGDMAYLSEGDIYIVGRMKDLIIINGKNHWPQDIEWAVEQLPGLKNGDIAAFGITTQSGEELPAVLVQCRMSDLSERADFKASVHARVKQITGMNCVVELVAPRSLPRTSSGKLSRTKARTLYLSGELAPLAVAA